MIEKSELEVKLWDELEAAKAKVSELTTAWAVEYRKRVAVEEEERINKLVEERLKEKVAHGA